MSQTELELPVHEVTASDVNDAYNLSNLAYRIDNSFWLVIDSICIPLDAALGLIRSNLKSLNGIAMSDLDTVRKAPTTWIDLHDENAIGDRVIIESTLYSRSEIIKLLTSNWQQLKPQPMRVLCSPDVESQDIREVEQPVSRSHRPFTNLVPRLPFRKNVQQAQPQDKASFMTRVKAWFVRRQTVVLWMLCAIPAFIAFLAASITTVYLTAAFDKMKLRFKFDGIVFQHSTSVSLAFVITATIAVFGAMMTIRFFSSPNSTHETVDVTCRNIRLTMMPATARLRLVAFGCGIVASYGLALTATTILAALLSR